jgi:replication factor C small subunit
MKDFQIMIKKQELANLLFSGPQGGGKTTVGLILCSKNGILVNKKDNLIFENGSTKKVRSINFVDNVVEPFLKHPPIGGDKYKVVFIDEADNLTSDSYPAWRGIIEKYHKLYGRFIFTCNYISKIPGPVQSRFTPYIFERIDKEYVLKYAKRILEAENKEFDDKSVNFVVENLYPDVRGIVNILWKCSLSGKLEVNEDTVSTTKKLILSNIVELVGFIERGENNKIGKTVSSVINLLESGDFEFRGLYTDLFFMKKFPAPAKVIVNKYSNSHQSCLVPNMHFMGMVFEIIKTLQEYKRLMVNGSK